MTPEPILDRDTILTSDFFRLYPKDQLSKDYERFRRQPRSDFSITFMLNGKPGFNFSTALPEAYRMPYCPWPRYFPKGQVQTPGLCFSLVDRSPLFPELFLGRNAGQHPIAGLNGTPGCMQFEALPELEFILYHVWQYLFNIDENKQAADTTIQEFILFSRLILGRITAGHTVADNLQKIHSVTLQRARQFLFHNFTRTISMEELARHCHTSVHYLSRIFKQFTAYAPARYLHMIRLKYAELLLRFTDLSLPDICYRSGFNRLDYFSAAFKKHYHMAPTVLKKAASATGKAATGQGETNQGTIHAGVISLVVYNRPLYRVFAGPVSIFIRM